MLSSAPSFCWCLVHSMYYVCSLRPFFDAIESRVFDIHCPLEALRSFRANDNVDCMNRFVKQCLQQSEFLP
ncbi:hypothetical protein RhiirB3_401227 [Rhizophagus irregularis]|nr:hypothetical protein RhiirB3_401227 [Rhizophagus irregularis]